MAEGLNKAILLGNLGADPELRYTQSGAAVMTMRLATSETYLDRNRQKQSRVEWHNICVWGRRAEALSKFLGKGDRLLVEGALRTSSYEDRQGVKKFKTEVIASNIVLSGGGRGGNQGGGHQRGDADESSSYTGGGGYEGYEDIGDDDPIPF